MQYVVSFLDVLMHFPLRKAIQQLVLCGSRLNATVLQFILIPKCEIMSTQVFLLLFFPFCKVGVNRNGPTHTCHMYII